MKLSKVAVTIYLLLISLPLCSQSGYAQPSVTEVSETIAHKGSIVVKGRGFGAKTPAAPLWWDDCEGAEDGTRGFTSGNLSWVVSGTLSGTSKHYSEAQPASGSEITALMTYRNVNFRQVPGPHSNSRKYATGGHWQFQNNIPQYSNYTYQNVNLTIDSGVANKQVWYVHWYYRVDPRWTVLNNYENHKKSAVNYGTSIYDSPNCYMSGGGASEGLVTGHRINYAIGNIIAGKSCSFVETNSGCNAKEGWVAIEQLWDSPNGKHEVWSFNGTSASGKESYVTSAGCENVKNNTRSFSIGGWYTTNTNRVESDKRGHVDNFRYFDDIYVDNTFSRVVLCNNSSYTSATIVEPQIPNAWADGEITVTVNQGSLSYGNAYLFVFDSRNNRNSVGYPVEIVQRIGPEPPTGLTVTQ